MFVLPSLHLMNSFDINFYQYLFAAISVYCKIFFKKKQFEVCKDVITLEHKLFTNTLVINFHSQLIDTLDGNIE